MQIKMNDLDNIHSLVPYVGLMLPMKLTVNFHHDKLMSAQIKIIHKHELKTESYFVINSNQLTFSSGSRSFTLESVVEDEIT
jgi:hypothetical protein